MTETNKFFKESERNLLIGEWFKIHCKTYGVNQVRNKKGIVSLRGQTFTPSLQKLYKDDTKDKKKESESK